MAPTLIRLALLLFLLQRTSSQDKPVLRARRNPVLVGDGRFELYCEAPPDSTFLAAKIDIWDKRDASDTVYGCQYQNGNMTYTRSGAIAAYDSCYFYSTKLSAYFGELPSSSKKLEIYCSTTVTKQNSKPVNVTSEKLNLMVLQEPASPIIFPSPVFNDNTLANISCSSRSGWDYAELLMKIQPKDRTIAPKVARGMQTVNINWMVSKHWHEATVTCNVTNYFIKQLYTWDIMYIGGNLEVTVSKNSVYTNEEVTIACICPTSMSSEWRIPRRAIMQAFEGTDLKGSITCNGYTYSNVSVSSGGVFHSATNEACFTKHSMVAINTTMKAEQLRLLRNLTVVCTVNPESYNVNNERPNISKSESWNHATQYIDIMEAPSMPSLDPIMVFMDGDVDSLHCAARWGRPEAKVLLVITNSQRPELQLTSENLRYASVRFTASGAWHSANITCSVLNHPLLNLIVETKILIIHVAANGTPDIVHTYSNESILDCGSYIVGFPEPTYQWSVPLQFNLSSVDALNSRYLLVGKRQSGLFNCTATNPVTEKNVTVTFTVLDAPPKTSTASQGEIIGAVMGSLAAFATIVFTTVIIIRRRRSKFISRLHTRCLDPKKSEPPANPTNVNDQTTGSGFATVTGDTVEYRKLLEHVYAELGENRGESGDAYSSLEKTDQNSAFSE